MTDREEAITFLIGLYVRLNREDKKLFERLLWAIAPDKFEDLAKRW